MKNIIFSLLALSAMLGLAACETAIDVPAPPHTPRISLLYILNTDTRDSAVLGQRQVFVSSSQGVFETKRLTGRTDATVEVQDASGTVIERFQPIANPSPGTNSYFYYDGYYRPTMGFVARPGQTYTIRAKVPSLETAESSLTLPATPVIASATYTPRTPPRSDPYNSYQQRVFGHLTLAVADNAATTDYYIAYARVLDERGRLWGYLERDNSNNSNDVSNLQRFELSGTGILYNKSPYADTNGNGQQLSLANDVQGYYNGRYTGNPADIPAPAYVEVVVGSLTRDMYLFYQSLGRYNNTGDNPFAEPAPLFSNIRPGYGLFGGTSATTYRIRL
ncbi:DUF4249 domain-containing protein [Hymenobacter sp. BT491]|uniref:DUF4249 domain-containing protein n=1 Tax=Hymenobacter sp. BT491 TaxID=2766779 RepID=UPI001653C37B|nr:DUF4249 domain-containing protein [Hymenobacter sp. BT491]MBC6988162.1 DUF4249 domain-containing protein [Hymenobacter sp. BT491]